MKKKAIPVSIITGFLGSGKTTLLNEILKKYPKEKFLIIENEVGNVNIDGGLINNSQDSKVIEMTSGCICCSLNSDLGTLINSLILSRVDYDHLLIEATGVADPSQIINMFNGARIQRFFSLDSVIGTIDADSFIKRVDEFSEAYQQITQSDILLINKCDLIDENTLTVVKDKTSTINPFAEIYQTTFARVDDFEVLNRDLFGAKRIEKSILNLSGLSIVKDSSSFIRPQVEELDNNSSRERNHAHKIQTSAINIVGDFDLEKVSVWLDDYLQTGGDNILRIKGVLNISSLKHKMVIQSVGNDFHVMPGSVWESEDLRQSTFVFIGTVLNEAEIEAGLKNCLV